jgi:prophage regulatory protein
MRAEFQWEISMENVQDQNRPVERLIRIGEVKRLTGLSTATLYRKMSAEDFPRPVRLGVAARAWPLSEVQHWIAGRIELRGGSNG